MVGHHLDGDGVAAVDDELGLVLGPWGRGNTCTTCQRMDKKTNIFSNDDDSARVRTG